MPPGYWPLVAVIVLSSLMSFCSCICCVALYLMAGDLRHSVEDIKGYLIYSREAKPHQDTEIGPSYRDFFGGPEPDSKTTIHMPDSLREIFKGE